MKEIQTFILLTKLTCGFEALILPEKSLAYEMFTL